MARLRARGYRSAVDAVVTGRGRGIGEAVARGLSERGYRVVGATRAQVDLADPASIAAYDPGPLALLVDDAAVALDGFGPQVVRDTLAVNLRGTIALTERVSAERVVVVSSGMGEKAGFTGAPRRALDQDLDVSGILAQADAFELAVARGELGGWPRSAYSVSKALINAYVRHLHRAGRWAIAVCPGWVRTDMGGASAPRSVAEGAAGVLWAATDPAARSGTFVRDGREIAW